MEYGNWTATRSFAILTVLLTLSVQIDPDIAQDDALLSISALLSEFGGYAEKISTFK